MWGLMGWTPNHQSPVAATQTEPVLRLHLQKHWGANRRRRSLPGDRALAVADDRRARHEPVLGERDRQRPAASNAEA